MPTIAQLKQAITIAEQIEKLQAELARLVGGSSPVTFSPAASRATPIKVRGKRTMSSATIAKMRAAQRARWAKKGPSAAPTTAEAARTAEGKPAAAPKKKKSKLSPEGRAKIVAALKARWAAKKAAK